MARLLPLMQAQNVPLGVGVEEDSAAVFQHGQMEVLGARGVLVVDLSEATRNPALPHFNVAGATLHWLESGDRFDIATRRVQAAPPQLQGTLLAPLNAAHKGYHRGPAFFTDTLAEGQFVKAMARLVDSDQRELRGLAFAPLPGSDDPAPTLGFEWRLWVDENTRGWLTLQARGLHADRCAAGRATRAHGAAAVPRLAAVTSQSHGFLLLPRFSLLALVWCCTLNGT